MSTLTTVIDTLKEVLSPGKFSVTKILPLPLLLCTSLRRPGLSAMDITAQFIAEMGNMNIPTGPNPDGSPNLINALAYAYSTVLVRNIKLNGVVQMAIPPGGMSLKGVGMSSAGPVAVELINDQPIGGTGIPM
jgi:hypothetical protein